jgi:aspartate aminotransferase-like enzyme
MPNRDWTFLLDTPPFPANAYAPLADQLAAILGTRNDVLLIQAEAVLALEAVATSLARPDLTALNIVTSPYGSWFGGWLSRGGVQVTNLQAAPAKPITIEAVEAALDAEPDMQILALVHAESASGILNPLEEIVALAKKRGIVTVVDAVASVGGHALEVDRLGIDIAVIGPQKSLAGPAGLSAISISKAAWAFLDHDNPPRDSMLSLIDQKKQWLEKGRGALPGTPAPLEFYALRAALQRVEQEGIANIVARHKRAASATRSALQALGATLWVEKDQASALVTTVILPEKIALNDFAARSWGAGSDLTSGVGPGAERLVRFNHTGHRASRDAVTANIDAYISLLKHSNVAHDSLSAYSALAKTYEDPN